MNNSFNRHGRSALLLAALASVGQPAFGFRQVAQNQFMIQQGQWAGDVMIWDGQVVVADPGQARNSNLADGFTLAAAGTDLQDTPAGEALKFMQARDWLKAIEAIEKLNTDDDRLVMDPNGILRPLSTLKSALIRSMPEEGQNTFRKLNDPAANTKLQQAKKLTDLTEREKSYQSLVQDYALCNASAEAADTLGDIRFEQGRFDEAAALYAFSANHPASTADDPMLMAKRLFALSRAGQWKNFDELAEYATFRHPMTSVTLGGNDITLRELIRQLSATRKTNTSPNNIDKGPERLALPRFDRPVRVFNQKLIDEHDIASIQQAASNYGIGGAIGDMIRPVVACDNDRIFTLALGSVARLDPQTGSDLWRKGSVNEHVNSINGRIYQLQQGYDQALLVADNTLLAVVPDANYPNRSRLIAYNTEDGEKRWSTENNSELRNLGVVGKPLIVRDQVYFVTQQPGEAQITLTCVSLEGGKFIRSLNLGSAPVDPNFGAPAELSPRLTMGQGYLFVQTNNGALVAIDPVDFSVAWAFSQRIRPSGMGKMRRRGMVNPNTLCAHTGTVVAYDGLVFSKDTRTNTVHAFREYDATPLWSAQTDDDATIVHIDSQFIYVISDELVAHDLRTGERVWWTPFAGEDAGEPIFTDKACIIAGSTRICSVDLKTGKLTDYSDQLAYPADLAVIGDKLIYTTGDDISGYRMPEPVVNRP